MKYLLTLLFLASFFAYGQEPPYTPMRLNYQFRGIKVDSLFLVPSFADTTSANSSTMKNVAGAMIRTGNDFWMRNSTTTAWLQNVNVGTGSSPSVQFVDSVWRVSGKDSIFWRKGGFINKIKDSTGLAKAVDTIYRTSGKDSIFFKISGTTYKIKDSLGITDTTSLSNRINLKQNQLNGTGFIKASGTTITYDNSTYKTRAIDTLYRKAGKDSIFWMTNGTEYRIKDSTSSYLGDSPDRIAGNATGEVKSDMQGWDLSIYDATEISLFSTDSLLLGNSGGIYLGGGSASSVVAKADSVIISGGDVKVGGGNTIITTNNDLTLDANNSGEDIKIDAAERVKLGNYSLGTNRVGHIKYAYKKKDIIMTTSDDTAHIPGTYIIKTASTTNTFYLPDAAEFPGQTIYLINFDVSVDSNIGSLGGSIYDAAQTTPSTILTTSFNIFTSDGNDWWFTYNQP